MILLQKHFRQQHLHHLEWLCPAWPPVDNQLSDNAPRHDYCHHYHQSCVGHKVLRRRSDSTRGFPGGHTSHISSHSAALFLHYPAAPGQRNTFNKQPNNNTTNVATRSLGQCTLPTPNQPWPFIYLLRDGQRCHHLINSFRLLHRGNGGKEVWGFNCWYSTVKVFQFSCIHGPDMDEFQNLLCSSLSTGTPVAQCSRKIQSVVFR